ncbi:MAG: RidA family protein [Streptosporangiales bacterium]
MSIDTRMQEAGIELPSPPAPGGQYQPVVVAERFAYVSGQTPVRDGVPTVTGKLGAGVSVEEAQEAARLATLNCVAQLKKRLGSLDRVERVVKLSGYVASGEGFGQQSLVVNGASAVLEEIFGEAGQHARVALGVAELPGGAPVEVEIVALVRSDA